MTTMTKPTRHPMRRRHGRTRILALAGGAILVLATAAGIATWQVAQRRGTTAVTAGAARQAQPTTAAQVGHPSDVDGAGEGPRAARTATPWYTRGGTGPTWYLVGSHDQQDDVGEVIGYRNLALLQDGKPLPTEEQVMVVGSPEEDARVQQAIGARNRLRAMNGLPDIQVIDLRAP